MNVFLDTSAIYAVMDADDKMHPRAKKIFKKLIQGRALLHTTNYILVETFTLLQSRMGMNTVEAFMEKFLPVLNVFWINEEIHLSALSSMMTARRKGLSFVDCSSFEVIRRKGLKKVFAFDRHFKEQGFIQI